MSASQYIGHMLSHFASCVLNATKEALAVSRCELCGRWPSDTGFSVCHDCLARHAPLVNRCDRCGIFQTIRSSACIACDTQASSLDQCIAAVDYAEPWIALIHRLKFQQDTGVCHLLAYVLHSRLVAHTQPHSSRTLPALLATDWVIPVPMHTLALSHRGYNQSWQLCKALKSRLKTHPIEGSERWEFRHDVLLKTTPTRQQHDLNRAQRLHNLASAFAVAPQMWTQIQGRSITLVDDIMTTGATLHAAANALRQQGAAHVQAWVIARTPTPIPSRLIDNQPLLTPFS
jgi:ComF family protein